MNQAEESPQRMLEAGGRVRIKNTGSVHFRRAGYLIKPTRRMHGWWVQLDAIGEPVPFMDEELEVWE